MNQGEPVKFQIKNEKAPSPKNEEPLLLIQQNMSSSSPEQFIEFLKTLQKHYKNYNYTSNLLEPVDFLVKFYDDSFSSIPGIRDEITFLLNSILLGSKSIRTHFIEIGFLDILSNLIPRYHTLLLLDTFITRSTELQNKICSNDFLANIIQYTLNPEIRNDAFYFLSGFGSNLHFSKIIRIKFGDFLIQHIFSSTDPKYVACGLSCLSTFSFYSLKWTKKLCTCPLFFQYLQSFNFFQNPNSPDLISFLIRFLKYDFSFHRDRIIFRIRAINLANPALFNNVLMSIINYSDFLMVTGQIPQKSQDSLLRNCFYTLLYLTPVIPHDCTYFFNPELINQTFPESYFEKLQNPEIQQKNPMLINFRQDGPRIFMGDLFILYKSDVLLFSEKIILIRLILAIISLIPLNQVLFLLQMEGMGMFQMIREVLTNDMFEASDELKSAIRNIQYFFESEKNPKMEEWENWLYFDEEISQGMYTFGEKDDEFNDIMSRKGEDMYQCENFYHKSLKEYNYIKEEEEEDTPEA